MANITRAAFNSYSRYDDIAPIDLFNGPAIGWSQLRRSKYDDIDPADVSNYSRSVRAITRWYATCKLSRAIKLCSNKYKIKTAIEWRPPQGIQYVQMMEQYDDVL